MWGDLRGKYFQNALLIGTLYVDVSNDTVVATKPKVEILPFRDANFRPVADFEHFACIAEKYWNMRIIPNHVLPLIAPYFPVFAVSTNGAMTIPHSDYLFGLVRRDAFRNSARVLASLEMDEGQFRRMAALLENGGLPVPKTLGAGKSAALAACGQYQAEGRHLQIADHTTLATVLNAVNELLKAPEDSPPSSALVLRRSDPRLMEWGASGHGLIGFGDPCRPRR